MRRLHAAVLGLGGMGRTQIEDLRGCSHVARITGFDTDPQARTRAAEKHGIRVAQTLSHVLEDRTIDLVYIATPNCAHAELAIAAMQAGKAVMSEKPMATTLADCERMVQVHRQTGRFLQIGFECRYSRLYARMKEILDSGEIGRLRNIFFIYVVPGVPPGDTSHAWRLSKEQSGGLYCEKLCHYVDLPRWWTGSRIQRFFAASADGALPHYQVLDSTHLTYEFENGVVSHLTFMNQPVHHPQEVEDIASQRPEGCKLFYSLVGTEGALEGNVFYRQLRVFHHPGKPGVARNTMVRVETWEKDEDGLYFHNTREQNRDIARRVALGEPPFTPPEDSLETMRFCFAVEEATGSWEVVTMGR